MVKPCNVEGCNGVANHRGMCGKHYQRLRRHGDPNVVTRIRGLSFWDRVNRRGKDECWLWTGPITTSGYGQTRWKDRRTDAHRVAWILTHGEIPEKMCVCHLCD